MRQSPEDKRNRARLIEEAIAASAAGNKAAAHRANIELLREAAKGAQISVRNQAFFTIENLWAQLDELPPQVAA